MKRSVNLFGALPGFDILNIGWQNVGGRFISYGSQSPADDPDTEFFAHSPGDLRLYVGDGSLTVYGWRCTVGGTPGTWVEIDFGVPGAGSVVILDTTAVSLRAYAGPSDPGTLFFTRGYLFRGDGGGGFYRLNPDFTGLSDNGVTIFQQTSNPTGAPFVYCNVGNDDMFKAQNCGYPFPLAQYSFDPTGAVPWGAELLRVTTLLSTNGAGGKFAGISFDPTASYTSNATEQVCQRAESQGFILDGQGCKYSADPSTLPTGGVIIFAARADGDVSTIPTTLVQLGYYANGAHTAGRTWTQQFGSAATILGSVPNLGPVGTVPALTVGDGVLVRIGASRSDPAGWSYVQYFAHVIALLEGGDIQLDTPLPALPGYDLGRQTSGPRVQSQHDLAAIGPNGYQDNLTIKNFILENVQLDGTFDRGTVIDCDWTDATFGYNMTGSVGADITCRVQKTHAVDGENNEFGAAQACHGMHIRSLVVQALMGTNAHGEELGTEGTRIDLMDLSWDATTSGTQTIFAVGQSSFDNQLISVGQMTLRGGAKRIAVVPDCHVQSLDIIAGNQQTGPGVDVAESAWYSLDLSKVDRLTYSSEFEPASRSYSGKRWKQYPVPFPFGAGSATSSWKSPIFGLVRQLRVFTTESLDNIALVNIKSSVIGGGFDIKSKLVVGEWVNIDIGQSLDLTYPNFWGLGALEFSAQTTGTNPPAGNQFVLDVEYFVPDPPYYSTTDPDGAIVGDASVPLLRVSDGPPSTNADFISQENLDTTNKVYYRAVSVGNGASDWVLSSTIPGGQRVTLFNGSFNASSIHETWAAATYRRIIATLIVESGNAADPLLTIDGSGTGNYYSSNAYTSNPASGIGTGALTQPMQIAGSSGWAMTKCGNRCFLQVEIDVASVSDQQYLMRANGLSNSFPWATVFGSGFSDSGTLATGLTFTFGGATVGHLNIEGITL